MSIKAITFDLDDTLWAVMPVIQKAERCLYDWLAQHHPAVTERFDFQTMQELRIEMHRAHPDMQHDLTYLRKKALQHLAELSGADSDLVEPAFEVFYQGRNQVEFFEDALPTLQSLQQNYILGSISNGNADIHRVGLSDLMSFQIRAEHVGAAKPKADIYQAALQHLNLDAAELVHVGDDWVNDVVGAAALGITAVWLNRDDKPLPDESTAHHMIRDLHALPGLLKQL